MFKKLSALTLIGLTSVAPVSAQDLEISLTNLTQGMLFTFVLAAAHPEDAALFTEGAPASPGLKKTAEIAAIDDLSAEIQAIGANVYDGTGGGTPADFLPAGATTTFNLMTDAGNTHLSLAAMIMPTNDAFVGANGLEIPSAPGTYTYFLNAYDAGVEANNELIDGVIALDSPGIPGDPSGLAGANGTGVTNVENNPVVHIHRGVLGDNNPAGGVSDLTFVHRWLNPVGKLVVTVK